MHHHIMVYAGDTSVYSRRIALPSSRSTALEKSGTKRRRKPQRPCADPHAKTNSALMSTSLAQ